MANLVTILFMLMAVGYEPAARAQTLPDPLRPPSFAPAAVLNQPESGLQTIWLPAHSARSSKNRKAFAVINGQRVGVGDSVGDQRVVKISEQEIVLQGAEGLKTLRISPDVVKTNVVGTAPKAAGKKSVTRKISAKENS